MGAPWPSSCSPSYTHTWLCFSSEPISNRFLHRDYQELPSSKNSPPARTCSTIFTLSPWLLPLGKYQAPASSRNLPFFFSRHTSVQPVKVALRTQQWQHHSSNHTPNPHFGNSSEKHTPQETSQVTNIRSSKSYKQLQKQSHKKSLSSPTSTNWN